MGGQEYLELFEKGETEAFESLSLSQDAQLYLGELQIKEPENWGKMSEEEKKGVTELFDMRLNEVIKLQGAKTSICIDAPQVVRDSKLAPLVEQYLTMIESSPKYFEAPGDIEQVNEAVRRLEEVEGLKPDNWEKLGGSGRLKVMQEAENIMAEVGHREACEVKSVPMTGGQLGYYDPNTSTINLREDLLLSNDKEAYQVNLDTLFHEGRHAYQAYNTEVREVHPNHSAIEEWRTNSQQYQSGESSFFDFKKVGFKLYWNQPVEYDARVFAGNMLDKLFKEWKL